MLDATDQALLQRVPVHHSLITNKGQYSGKDPRPQNNDGWSELTKICHPKPLDSICVGENHVNKVEEGAPAKVTQKKNFTMAAALRRVRGERISWDLKAKELLYRDYIYLHYLHVCSYQCSKQRTKEIQREITNECEKDESGEWITWEEQMNEWENTLNSEQ